MLIKKRVHMKKYIHVFKGLILLAMTVLLLSACGTEETAQPTPTVTPIPTIADGKYRAVEGAGYIEIAGTRVTLRDMTWEEGILEPACQQALLEDLSVAYKNGYIPSDELVEETREYYRRVIPEKIDINSEWESSYFGVREEGHYPTYSFVRKASRADCLTFCFIRFARVPVIRAEISMMAKVTAYSVS